MRPSVDALHAAGDAHGLPHSDCYWVLPGRLLAGAYPELHLDALLAAGIDCFVDLTRDGDVLAPYALRAQGRARWHGFAITDYAVPGVALMRRIVDVLEAELARGARVYLHCHAGVGRTGTAVGCWLVEQGLTGGEALKLIAYKRDALLGQSPETEAQREFVRRWRTRQSPA
jgi:protein-tyrosine phosphatase